ncbi:TPA: restriction endonuclease subunit S [Photobacterium damselae]
MSELPKGWKLLQIDQVTEVVSGGTPKSTNASYYTEDHDSGIAWVTPADLSGYKAYSISHGRRSITQEGYDACSAKLMPKGTVLFSSRAPVGYVVIAENEISTNQGFKSFVPCVGVDSKYLYFYLKSIKHLAESLSTGTTFKELSGKVAKTLPFPLAPLNEQKRIVEKLDEVLAQVDTIKARLDGIPAILKRFRQSVLAAAVSGKLTEEWRVGVYTTANNAHTKLSEFRGKALKSLPSNWIWVRFDSVNEVASNLVDPLDNPRDFHIAPNHIESKSGRLLDYTTVEEDKVKSSKHRFFSGQVLYSKIRPYLCKAVLVDFNGVCSADMYPLNTQMEPQYLLNWLLSDQFTEWASNGDSRTVLPKINKKQLSEIPCPLPPIDEQKEIVRLVDQYFAFADTIEAQVKKAQTRVDNLTQSILAKAFRGELVEQDPNDEPADKLLERIAVARKEAEALAKAAKKAQTAKKRTVKKESAQES